MLKSYTFVETAHQKLHDFVIAFFDRIENEVGEFNLDFFEREFRPIVNRHRKILKNAFKEIYSEIRCWSQEDRSLLCEEIRQSNKIKEICSGKASPRRFGENETAIYQKIKIFFLQLYTDVLDGAPVHDELGVTLRQHFEDFRRANQSITICPMCGISELKTEHDTTRDQYDHYLPKALYPFSAVNFHNLIPVCKECNSFDVKGEKDILALRNTKLFYPYDQSHKGIDIRFSIQNSDTDIDSIEWRVECNSLDGKDQEVDAWKKIYNIEDRYVGFVKGRIRKWYKAYWRFQKADSLKDWDEGAKRKAYFVVLGADEAEFLTCIKKPALSTFLNSNKNILEKATQEAHIYS